MSSYYQRNREKLIENQLRYYRKNRERCLEYFRAYNRDYYLRHRAPKAGKPPSVPKLARVKKEKPVRAAKIAKEPPKEKVKPATIPKEKKVKTSKIPKAPKIQSVQEVVPFSGLMEREMFVLSF
tara:strand:+ start:111 stop:482 length:372 start_codon:yes stop_codon:yes gene_type:complete